MAENTKETAKGRCAIALEVRRCFEISRHFSHLDSANLMKIIAERQKFVIEFENRLGHNVKDVKIDIEKLEPTPETLETRNQMIDYYNQQIGMILGIPVRSVNDID